MTNGEDSGARPEVIALVTRVSGGGGFRPTRCLQVFPDAVSMGDLHEDVLLGRAVPPELVPPGTVAA